MGESVVRDWMSLLPLRMQTVILCALRGCDGMPKNDVSKKVVRCLRAVVLKHGSPPGVPSTFMDEVSAGGVFGDLIRELFGDVDKYPIHFLMHLLHSAEMVGFYHPDKEVANQWMGAYLYGIDKLHVLPESKEDLINRLG